MHAICETCGTQFDDRPDPPERCPVCEDDRQYVGWGGQAWTTHDALAVRYRPRLEEDGGLLGLGLTPSFAINQRALLLPTKGGNVMWESLSLVTDQAVAALRARGGVDAIVISHPHFYAAMVEWSHALGNVPIVLHEADRAWVQRSSPALRWWSGDRIELWPGVQLTRCGGHFPGSTALHWRDAHRPRGALFPGDALQVVQDRRHVSFMYSYPNLLPMPAADVRHMRALLRDAVFDDVYGYTWGRNIMGDGRAAVDASFDRYLAAVTA